MMIWHVDIRIDKETQKILPTVVSKEKVIDLESIRHDKYRTRTRLINLSWNEILWRVSVKPVPCCVTIIFLCMGRWWCSAEQDLTTGAANRRGNAQRTGALTDTDLSGWKVQTWFSQELWIICCRIIIGNQQTFNTEPDWSRPDNDNNNAMPVWPKLVPATATISTKMMIIMNCCNVFPRSV